MYPQLLPSLCRRSKLFKNKSILKYDIFNRKINSANIKDKGPDFGLLFDIDGVIVRGRKLLPSARPAFELLLDSSGNFRIPTVFVTNAGNSLRNEKAAMLTKWLGVEIHEDQVIMAHSPLKLFDSFFDKNMLVSGQGPITEIAKNLGFHKTTTVDNIASAYPQLDCVDHKRRHVQAGEDAPIIPKIDALLLFGEPVRWETSLQFLIDTLLTNGDIMGKPTAPYPHMPILACNMDLQWMAEAHMPRFGHGTFLLCLETLYKKLTGKDMIYTALVGKPSEITYYHSETMVQQHAQKINITHPIRTLYAIGDNIHTDIFGINLYRKYVKKRKASQQKVIMQGARGIDLSAQDFQGLTAENCFSVLVQTGVPSGDNDGDVLQHSPRDFLPVESNLQKPCLTAPDVLGAINAIFDQENFS